MEENLLKEALMSFGMTRQEAVLYLCLCENGCMTGYEIAKLTGISRSNAYSGLSGLVDKGAALMSQGAAKKYTPVGAEEFCDGRLRALEGKKSYLMANVPGERPEEEGYLTITGDETITSKIFSMIKQTRERIYVSMDGACLEPFLPKLWECAKEGIKVVALSDKKLKGTGIKTYLTGEKEYQIGIIVDSSFVLTGELGRGRQSVCLYSGQRNFVRVFKDSLTNEIKLIELTKGDM